MYGTTYSNGAQSSMSSLFNPFKKKKVENNNVFSTNQSNTGSIYTQPVGVGVVKLREQVTTPTVKPAVTRPVVQNQQSRLSDTIPAYAKSTPLTTKKTTSDPFAKKTDTSATSKFLDEISRVSGEQTNYLNDRAKADEEFYNRVYDRKNQALRDQAPLAQQAFDQFKGSTEAGANQAKANAEEQWGNDQRALAQTRRETEGRLGNKFAGLNTVDSFGAGSYKAANENMESEFNRSTAQGLRQKSSNIAAIEQKATDLISQEAIKLNQTLLQIENSIFENEDDRALAIKQAYDEARAGILSIKDNLANTKYQAALSEEQAKYDSGKQLTAGEMSNLADFDNGITQLESLKSVIDPSVFGPIQGKLNGMNPYNTNAQAIQSKVKAVAQVVGRAMEGGVLRQEDVPKYEAILPKLTDTPQVAMQKIENVKRMLTNQRDTRRSGFESAGYNAGSPQVTTQTEVNQNDPLGLGL